MKNRVLVLFLSLLSFLQLSAQLQANFTSTLNTICNGSGCDYEGPSILIN